MFREIVCIICIHLFANNFIRWKMQTIFVCERFAKYNNNTNLSYSNSTNQPTRKLWLSWSLGNAFRLIMGRKENVLRAQYSLWLQLGTQYTHSHTHTHTWRWACSNTLSNKSCRIWPGEKMRRGLDHLYYFFNCTVPCPMNRNCQTICRYLGSRIHPFIPFFVYFLLPS